MATLDLIAVLAPEAQDANLSSMMTRAGRYVVYNDAVDRNPQEMHGFASLRAAKMYRDIDPVLRPDILDRDTQDVL